MNKGKSSMGGPGNRYPEGFFNISGSSSEITKIDPELRMYVFLIELTFCFIVTIRARTQMWSRFGKLFVNIFNNTLKSLAPKSLFPNHTLQTIALNQNVSTMRKSLLWKVRSFYIKTSGFYANLLKTLT